MQQTTENVEGKVERRTKIFLVIVIFFIFVGTAIGAFFLYNWLAGRAVEAEAVADTSIEFDENTKENDASLDINLEEDTKIKEHKKTDCTTVDLIVEKHLSKLGHVERIEKQKLESKIIQTQIIAGAFTVFKFFIKFIK